MATTLHVSSLLSEESSKSYQLCSMCNSIGHRACIDHCQAVFCTQCTDKHRIGVIQQMHQLVERLKMYQIKRVNSHDIRDENYVRVSNEIERSTNNSIE